MQTITDLQTAMTYSINPKPRGSLAANFTLQVDGKPWHCYEISIAHRDLLCFCDQGTATLLVDTYGDKNTCELFDWELNK